MAQFSVNKSDFVQASSGEITKNYTLLDELGRGSFGRVYRVRHIMSGSIFALKSVPRMRITDVAKLLTEFNVLMLTDHPQIVKIYSVIENAMNVNIVMELCEGGELLKDCVALTEFEAMKVMKQILNAVSYLHSRGICHRDLKPENILFAIKGNIDSLKIIDFGLAKVTSSIRGMRTRVGSPYYVSPDVLRGKYGIECDLWSAGVIMYVLLSGKPPFTGRNQTELFSSILKGVFNFDGEEWAGISAYAKDLISRLLVMDPSERPTAQRALEHNWFLEELPNGL